ncbi:MAG: TraR/DksA family transcriptional regulator [Puniceicoccaceae bacterium]
MNPYLQETFRPGILEKLAELKQQLDADGDNLKAIEPDVAIGRLSRLDAMQMQQMALATRREVEAEIRRLELALKRIDQGKFGTCNVCHKDIDLERLTLAPGSPTCLSCLSKYS